ncbi:MAG: UDP-N-acetylglucosamine 2-epimerase (non-hydrolyzing) [Candidatus Marinimicrobia bacterium]|nr:UDP-N-acetylglucosamine 2-epimerase (non-hydrolyzing) [Candidatus Neomarinimicrobiota bacterium]
MLKIATIIGARPQFIKCAPVSREIHKYFSEILIHTGQHYDQNMSQAFFEELDIPEPDIVLVYGDTNSTIAGALAASKLHIPVAHVEAGLRSFNRKMPEEINRIVSDKLSKYLFVPTQTAVNNLSKEGQTDGVYNVGDVMFDSFLYNLERTNTADVLNKFNVRSENYILTTVHRPQNTDDPQHLSSLISAIQNLHEFVIFPIHPRTRNLMKQFGIEPHSDNLFLIDPVSYREMIALEKHARAIITDSGGVQKEAFFARVPCLVIRGETEWVELVENGWAHLIGNHFELIPKKLRGLRSFDYTQDEIFGDGNASGKIAEILKTDFL